MKKELKKRVKDTTKAVRYFSGENKPVTITKQVILASCSIISWIEVSCDA